MPSGIRLGIGCGVMIVITVLAAALTEPGSPVRLLAVVLPVAVGAALIPSWRHSALFGVIAYLLYIGFLVNQYGELAWDLGSGQASLMMFLIAYLAGRVKAVSRIPHRPSRTHQDG